MSREVAAVTFSPPWVQAYPQAFDWGKRRRNSWPFSQVIACGTSPDHFSWSYSTILEISLTTGLVPVWPRQCRRSNRCRSTGRPPFVSPPPVAAAGLTVKVPPVFLRCDPHTREKTHIEDTLKVDWSLLLLFMFTMCNKQHSSHKIWLNSSRSI